jgi:phosphate transport system substrate-binding protein
MKKILIILIALTLSASAFAVGEQETTNEFSGDYAFGGSTTVDPIITAAIEEWKELYPDVHISYEGVGSSNGIKGILDGTYSLGAASRELKDGEKEDGALSIPIALDALAIVVNGDTVPISNLTIQQVAEIFAGQITNWNEVGGPDEPIVVFNRDEASGTYETFEKKILGKDYEFMQEATVVTSNGDMAAKVGSTPYAIGYVGLGFIDNPGLEPLNLEGVAPNIENVYNKTYPVQRFLNVVYKGELDGVEKAFVDYLLGEDGQAIVEDLDFIPLP